MGGSVSRSWGICHSRQSPSAQSGVDAALCRTHSTLERRVLLHGFLGLPFLVCSGVLDATPPALERELPR
jgi:hypothetical protein